MTRRTMKPLPKRLLILLYPLAKRFISLFPIPVLSSWMIGLTHQSSSASLVCWPRDDMSNSPSRLLTLEPPALEDLAVLFVVGRLDSSLVSHRTEELWLGYNTRSARIPCFNLGRCNPPRSFVRLRPSCPSPQSLTFSWKMKVFFARSLGTCTSYSSGIPRVSYFRRLPGRIDDSAWFSSGSSSTAASGGRRRCIRGGLTLQRASQQNGPLAY